MADCQIAHQLLPSVFTATDATSCCVPTVGVVLGEVASASIQCDKSNNIISLSVINKGSFPTVQISQFFALTKLTSITLESVGLTGSIPELPLNLVFINFKNNNLKGAIPSFPSGLKLLDLSFNQLTGSIPSLPPTLTSLSLWNNQLTGSIPAFVAGMTTVVLTQNQLTGQIPDLPITLRDLELASNNLEGSIPQLPSVMVALNLANNKLTGTIPPLPTFTKVGSGTVAAAMLDGNCFSNAASNNVVNNCGTKPPSTTAATMSVPVPVPSATVKTTGVTTTGTMVPFGRVSTTINSTAPSSQQQDSGPNVGAIAGGIFGALVLLVIIGGVLWWVQQRKKQEYKHSSGAVQPDSESRGGDGATIAPSLIYSDGSTSIGFVSAAKSGETVVSEKRGAGASVFTVINEASKTSTASFLASITPIGSEKHLFEEGGSGGVFAGSGLPAEVTSWTVENVAYWIYFNHGGERVARNVIDQKVDGITLMNADIDDLISILDFEKLGEKVAFKLLLSDMRRKAQTSLSYDAPPAY
ncbi:L domain-like protein [Rhizoclosmatium globosum]|uniref:L domain-like protein n=1 Tax=Rhizoclosmatium globosum TaxID=329046 RepID=A0A1Y2CP27_9FUNG|nr:L domain-like protein [Rhizoclosmatium globosum]|eukprot:ORY48743.1 L domain-like protein [Rhizoclosmatium globosum]